MIYTINNLPAQIARLEKGMKGLKHPRARQQRQAQIDVMAALLKTLTS